MHHRVDHPLLVDEALGLQLVQRLRQLAGLCLELGELALQLHPRMLSRRKKPQGPPLDGELGQRRHRNYSASTATASSGMPSEARTLVSISRDSSGFSRRNSRALSRPWPIFSPL